MAGIVRVYGFVVWCGAMSGSNLGIDPDGYIYFQFQNKYTRDFIKWKPNISRFISWRPTELNVKTLDWQGV